MPKIIYERYIIMIEIEQSEYDRNEMELFNAFDSIGLKEKLESFVKFQLRRSALTVNMTVEVGD